jgi:hypothetical protein
MTTLLRPPRLCPLCGNPTPTSTLVETHVGPTQRFPYADVVLWLCVACAVELTEAADDANTTAAADEPLLPPVGCDHAPPSRRPAPAGASWWGPTGQPATDGPAPPPNP